MLEDHADAPAQRLQLALAKPADLAAFDEDFAGIRPLQPVEAADQRRLAGAAAADDAEDFALAHAQRDAVQRRRRAEPALHVDQAHDIFGRLVRMRAAAISAAEMTGSYSAFLFQRPAFGPRRKAARAIRRGAARSFVD